MRSIILSWIVGASLGFLTALASAASDTQGSVDSSVTTIASVLLYASGGWIVGELHNAVQNINGDRIAKAKVLQSLVASFFMARLAFYGVVEYEHYVAMAGYFASFVAAYLGSRLVQAIGDATLEWLKGIIANFGQKRGG